MTVSPVFTLLSALVFCPPTYEQKNILLSSPFTKKHKYELKASEMLHRDTLAFHQVIWCDINIKILIGDILKTVNKINFRFLVLKKLCVVHMNATSHDNRWGAVRELEAVWDDLWRNVVLLLPRDNKSVCSTDPHVINSCMLPCWFYEPRAWWLTVLICLHVGSSDKFKCRWEDWCCQ